jgi:hypothetical protein
MRKYLLLLIPFLILSCTTNKFEFNVDVDAEVIGSTYNYIGVKYKIYGKDVFQDIHISTSAEHAYYAAMKTIPLTVRVIGHDRDGNDYILLTLTHRGSLFGKEDVSYSKLSMHDFITKDMEIRGFIWEKYNDEEYDGGISPQELRAKLKKDGDQPPETKVIITVEEKKGEDKSL